MGTPKWTKTQQQVIDLAKKNILVSAAAGSGKTAVLVERIIEKITKKDHPADIDRLVVVTFTKAAAAEMRARLEVGLEKRLALDPENAHIRRQVSLVHAAHICTIDSFCQWIIKNYFSVIDLDPVFRVADENELKLLKKDILGELLEEKYQAAQAGTEKNFLFLTQTLGNWRKDNAIEEVVLKLYEKSESFPWREEWLKNIGFLYQATSKKEWENAAWIKDLLSYVSAFVHGCREWEEQLLLVCEKEDGPGTYADAILADIAMLKNMENFSTYGEYRQAFATLKFKNRKSIPAKEKYKVDPLKEELVRTQRDKIKDYLKKKIGATLFFQDTEQTLADTADMAPAVRELSALTLSFHQKYTKAKRERSIVDYADLEAFALEILVKKENAKPSFVNGQQPQTTLPCALPLDTVMPTQVALELQEYFDEIFIDEYQDSNDTQELILSSLCRGPEKKPYMFMVGDVKQSIYGFRQARPEIFLEKYRRYRLEDSGEQKILLRENFRSRKAVLDFANRIFSAVMQKDLGGIAYGEKESLVAGAYFPETKERTAGKPELILIEEKCEGDFVPKRQLEAAAVAEKIDRMVSGNAPMAVKDGDSYRPARYRDIAILMRSLDGVEEFMEVLSERGIPAYAEKKQGYFSATEVEIVLNFLRVIDNPRQDIPLVSVMRSCLFSFTDEELAKLGALPAGLDFYDKILAFLAEEEEGKEEEEEKEEKEEEKELRMKLATFLTRLSKLRAWEKFHTVYELLRRIYFDTDYYAIVSAMPAGEKKSANLDLLLQHALTIAESGKTGIYAFTRTIENLQKSGVDFGEANVNGENTDAVRIMTIHKSKGLEFPVVILAGLGREFHRETGVNGVMIDKDYGIGCAWADTTRHVKSPMVANNYLKVRETLNNRAEEVRVLYVALTRAKEKLILTGTQKDLCKTLGNRAMQGEGGKLNFVQLSLANSYLDWVLPVILQGNLKSEVSAWCANESRTPFAGQDEFCAVTFTFPEHLVRAAAREKKADTAVRESLLAIDPGTVYDAEMKAALQQQENFTYPYAADAKLPARLTVTQIKRAAQEKAKQAMSEGVAEAEEVFLLKEKDVAPKKETGHGEEKRLKQGAAYGTLCHLVMQHLPLARLNQTKENLCRFVQEFLEEMQSAGYITAEEKNSLRAETFAEFLNSNLGRRMAAAACTGTLRREQPFMLGLKANELIPESNSAELIPVQGIIDAYFAQGGHLVLVDYKTDAVRPGQESLLIGRYQKQLNLYAQALETILKKPVGEKWIYSFALAKEISVK